MQLKAHAPIQRKGVCNCIDAAQLAIGHASFAVYPPRAQRPKTSPVREDFLM
jgi:hypothetical protein